jgi:hypothetical protein
MLRNVAVLAVCGLFLMALVGPASAVNIRTGFSSNYLAANDDGSTGQILLPFSINFFGTTYSGLYANNNGNLTFTGPMYSYTPWHLAGTGTVIIAPFFADVDTRSYPSSDLLRYGSGTVGGRLAWGATWDGVGVGYYSYNTDRLNKFQVVLIDRSDVAAGDFDFEFNYDQIQWDTGEVSATSAVAGYSNGMTGSAEKTYEIPGSLVSGAFFDSNLDTGLIRNSSSGQPLGRYLFEVRSGEVHPAIIPEPLTMATFLFGVTVLGSRIRRRLS